MGSRQCCDTDKCIRKELATLLDPEAPILDRIGVAACAVASTCGNLTVEDLHTCASRLFDVPPECELAEAFIVAYHNEKDLAAETRAMEKRRAAKVTPGE